MKLKRIIERNWYTAEGAAYNGSALYKRLSGRFVSYRPTLLTLTVDPSKHESPHAAWLWGKSVLRKTLYDLQKALGRDIRYFWKLEVQGNGYPHWHIVLDTRIARHEFDAALRALASRWLAGSSMQGIDVKRIQKGSVKYLLKYVSKDGGWPEWMLDRCRIRIVGASLGFWDDGENCREKKRDSGGMAGDGEPKPAKPERPKRTYREMLELVGRLVCLLSAVAGIGNYYFYLDRPWVEEIGKGGRARYGQISGTLWDVTECEPTLISEVAYKSGLSVTTVLDGNPF